MKSPLKRQKKTFRIPHLEPGEFRLGYVVLPVGYAYNADIAKAKKGDTLRLFEGEEYKIFAVRRICLNKPEADILCRMRYGITAHACLMRWQLNAKLEGHGEKAVSEDECLWVIYSTDEHDQG